MLLFRWDEYTCHNCKYGKCPLDYLTLDAIKNLEAPKQTPDEYSWGYCVRLAVHYFKHIDRLEDTFCDGISITYYSKCGHYVFGDGRHRTCVIAHLLKKGSKTTMFADLQTIDEWVCPQCYTKKDNSASKKLTLLDKLFKTKKYRIATHQPNIKDRFCYFEEEKDD